MDAPLWAPPNLAPGESIAGYASDHLIRVRRDGRKIDTAVYSPFPARATGADGIKRPKLRKPRWSSKRQSEQVTNEVARRNFGLFLWSQGNREKAEAQLRVAADRGVRGAAADLAELEAERPE